MTQANNWLDLSFLNEEEADKILQVLKRDEALKNTEEERIRKLQKVKRDVKWSQGVTGKWFEEVQHQKYENNSDVNSLLKQPLTCRLKKKVRGDLKTSSLSQKKEVQHTGLLRLQSPFTSLFSFTKSARQIMKQQSDQQM
nr:PREDICTED: exophilin-5 [Latimeria chalumnae]|eukprot:XP_006008071.1 PREDICTED: exophilin-5 [Latimeria chalumnae]